MCLKPISANPISCWRSLSIFLEYADAVSCGARAPTQTPPLAAGVRIAALFNCFAPDECGNYFQFSGYAQCQSEKALVPHLRHCMGWRLLLPWNFSDHRFRGD
jgi:hypothetical protein